MALILLYFLWALFFLFHPFNSLFSYTFFDVNKTKRYVNFGPNSEHEKNPECRVLKCFANKITIYFYDAMFNVHKTKFVSLCTYFVLYFRCTGVDKQEINLLLNREHVSIIDFICSNETKH